MSLWQRITAPFRSKTEPQAASRGRSAATLESQPLWLQYQRIGGNLTPAQVSSILYEADGGDIYRLVQLANECRQKDGHLHSVLSTRENALNGLNISIDAHKDRSRKEPRRKDKRVAEATEDAILGAVGEDDEVKGFDDLLPHLLGGIYHGHATAQTVWAKRNGLIVPVGFRLHNQRRFRFRQDDGKLVWSDRWGGTMEGVDLQAKFPGQFIVHRPRVNGDVPAMEGLSRLLVWAALFRNWSMADWLKLAELSWKPWRIGKYGENVGEEDQENLLRMLERLTSNGVAIHRKDVDVDISQPGAGGGSRGMSNHHELCEFMAGEMSKAVLGQTLTTESGNRGARSLGEVHDRVRQDIRDSDAKALFATLRRDLIRPFVRMNFGPSAPVPGGWFDTEDAIDVKAYSEALGTLKTKAEMRIPEKWAHDQLGIPLPDEDERCLGDLVEGEENAIDVDVTGLDESSSDDPNEGTEPDGAQDESEPEPEEPNGDDQD